MKRIGLTLAVLLVFVLALVSCGGETPITSSADTSQTTAETTAAITTKDPNAVKYDEAFALIEQGKYEAAYQMFTELGDYRDAKDQLANFRYVPTKVVTQDLLYGNTTNIEFLYNEKNFPIRETNTRGTYTAVYEYTYDNDGNLTETNYVDNYRIVYTYDENQRVSQMAFLYQTNVTSYISYTYDAKGNLIKQDTGAGSVRVYLYDENNNITKTYIEGIESANSNVSEYFYDVNGYLVKETFAMLEGSIDTVIEYSYNANGDLIHTVYEKGTEYENGIEYIYDANRRLIQKTVTDALGQKTVYDYSYDDAGNLIMETMSKSGTLTETQSYEYKLVYFPFTRSKEINAIVDISKY